MKFGKMMACVAVLGCTSAVNLETQNTLEADSKNRWTPSERLIELVNRWDSENEIGFRGALYKCARTGQGEVCEALEDDLRKYDTLIYYLGFAVDAPEIAVNLMQDDSLNLAGSYEKFSGNYSSISY